VIDIYPTTATENQVLYSNHSTLYSRIGKRVFDLLFALLLLPVIAPLIFMLWVIVIADGGSGFFGHERIGKNGRVFRCWKIRSMVPDAENSLGTYLENNPEATKQWALNFKLDNDPRITRIGNFIRATSLDELPQILNVIKGEMSFVGPRPVTQVEQEKYGLARSAYLATTPGITGLWQVSGRNTTSYDKRVELDMQYAQTKSLALDLWIITLTAGAVLKQTGQ
jgi:exopolysaccharide production protein ExoY